MSELPIVEISFIAFACLGILAIFLWLAINMRRAQKGYDEPESELDGQ